MKSTLFTGLLVCISLIAAAQVSSNTNPSNDPSDASSPLPLAQLPDYYWQQFKKEAAKDDCKKNGFLTGSGFAAVTRQLFSRVIVGSDGLPKEGTASSLAIDNETAKIGGNVNFAPFKKQSLLFNLGVAGITSSKQLQFFGNDEYRKGFSISAGLNMKIGKSIFYYSDSCKKFGALRLSTMATLINRIKKIPHSLDLQSLEILTSNQYDSLRVSGSFLSLKTMPDTIAAINERLKKNLDSLSFINKYIGEMDFIESKGKLRKKNPQKHFVSKSAEEISEIIEEELEAFETKNAVLTGYTLHWLNLAYSFSNNEFNIFDTSLTNRFGTVKKEAFSTSSGTFTYNYARSVKRLLAYGYIGLTYGNRYALEDVILQNDSLIGGPLSSIATSSVKAVDVSNFSQVYNRPYDYVMLHGGGFMFFGESRIVGIELYAAARAKINTPELIDHRPSYSLRFGPLFSMTKKDGIMSNGTLGLIFQANDFTPGKNNFKDRFSFGIRLGIPFANIRSLQ